MAFSPFDVLGSSPTLFSKTVSWTSWVTPLVLLVIAYYSASTLYHRYISPIYRQNAGMSQLSSKSGADEKTNFGFGDVRVSGILVHPIKSCRGTAVQHARYTPQGLENDRKWSIIDAKTISIMTAREFPRMVLITPRIELDGTSPRGGQLTVAFPEDSGCKEFSVPLQPTEEDLRGWKMLSKIVLWPTHDAVDGYICESLATASAQTPSDVLSEYFGKPVHLVYKGPRPRPIDATTMFPDLKATAVYQDMYPLLVLSEESTGAIESELRTRVGTQGISENWKSDKIMIQRFRPNIIFSGGGPFAEDSWEEIEIGEGGSPRITLVSKCARCLLPNVSPETGERDKAVPYKVIMKFRTHLDPVEKLKPCVGCNGVPAGEGVVRVGDAVTVKKMLDGPLRFV